ncbi:MAG TPA: hypothetical protein VLE43_13960 [Candidatus Saccharimonadia bacterium]|nr:hypothetical protein [Candidatus Saccharimonadia bacterium]
MQLFQMAIDIIPYGMSNDEIQNGFARSLSVPCEQIYWVLRIFTVALAFAGLLMAAYRVQMGGDLGGLGTQLISTVVVAASLTFVPRWILDAQIALGPYLLAEIGVDIESVMNDFLRLLAENLAISIASQVAKMMLGFLFLGLMFMGVIAIIIIIIAFVIAIIVYVMVIVGFLCQIAAVYIGLSIMPIFLGMLLFDKTRETGFKYIIGMVGILFWQLGWGLGFLCIQETFGSLQQSCREVNTLSAINFVFGGIVTAALSLCQALLMYSVVTKAPKIISAAIVSGSQIGSAMVSAGGSTIMGAASGAVSAGAQAGMMVATSGASAPASGAAMGSGAKK